MIRNYLFSIMYFFISFLIGTFLITIFDYFNLLSVKIISVLQFLIPIMCIFIASFFLGSHSVKKGYMEGIKVGVTIIGLFVIIILLFDHLSIYSFVYYAILLLSSVLGGMLGINWKKN